VLVKFKKRKTVAKFEWWFVFRRAEGKGKLMTQKDHETGAVESGESRKQGESLVHWIKKALILGAIMLLFSAVLKLFVQP
jgi:hypothetical protein